MKSATTSKATIFLSDFNFDTKDVEMLHRQFSGERSKLIYGVDDLLRTWANANVANKNIHMNYHLGAESKNGQVTARLQSYQDEHVGVVFQLIAEPVEIIQNLKLDNPKQVMKLYDLAFAAARPTAPAYSIGSYYTLREVIARVAPHATYADVNNKELSIHFMDDDDLHIIDFRLTFFPILETFVEKLNLPETPAEETAEQAS